MRPVIRNTLRYESLTDGTVDMIDLARIHDALNVADENDLRMRDAPTRG